jgi:hypothetical protein
LDVGALLVMLAAVGAMMSDVYYLGITSFGGGGTFEANTARDSAFFRVARDAFIAALAFAWLSYRVIQNSTREKFGSV